MCTITTELHLSGSPINPDRLGPTAKHFLTVTVLHLFMA